MLAHEKWKPGIPRCHDLSNLDTDSIGSDEIRQLARFIGERTPLAGAGRVAVVANRDLEFGIARMMRAYVSELIEADLQIFRSREEAFGWLKS